MDDGASLSTLPLPVVDLSQEAKEGFLGVGHVAVRGPAQELEVTHHELAFLKLQRSKSCGGRGKSEFYFYPTQPIIDALKPLHVLHTSLIQTSTSAGGDSVNTSDLLKFNCGAPVLNF